MKSVSMLKKTLVFDHELSGHHIEYIHHLYSGAGLRSGESFVFLLHPDFKNLNRDFIWPDYSNVKIVFFDPARLNINSGNSIYMSYRLCKLVNEFAQAENVTHIFLISMIIFLPFLPFVISDKLKISGIIYQIALRSYKSDRLMKRCMDKLKYGIFTRSRIIDRVFMLNDPASARFLNKKLNSSVFRYLSEPLCPIDTANIEDIRIKYGIAENKKVFLHFGGLASRKGTLIFLKACDLLADGCLDNMCLIIAGNVNEEIKQEFYEMVTKLEGRVQILVFDEFTRYSFLASLCSVAAYIVLPYRNTSRSSGVLGYSSQFGVPVIGPSGGLIGNIIRYYRLGYCYELPDPESLSRVLYKHTMMPAIKINGDAYMSANQVSKFQHQILD
jgi:glycosyltransferase involved in cell wall biosynthesis